MNYWNYIVELNTEIENESANRVFINNKMLE